MTQVIQVQFQAPKVCSMVVSHKEKTLNLKLDWASAGLADVVIKKVKGGFTYEDKQIDMKREFIGKGGLEYMMWEFELPAVVKNILLSL